LARIREGKNEYLMTLNPVYLSKLEKTLGINDVNIHRLDNVLLTRSSDIAEVDLLINTRNFYLVNNEDLSNYDIFKVSGLERYNIHHCGLKKTDGVFKTIRHCGRGRKSSDREVVFIYELAKRYNLTVHNGKHYETYNTNWDNIIESYYKEYPSHRVKISKQMNLIEGLDMSLYKYVYKDCASLSINKKAKEYFYEEFNQDKNYIFDYNKWCAADIWLSIDKIDTLIADISSLIEINRYLKYKNDIVGISLKMDMSNPDSAKIELINSDYDFKYRYEYMRSDIATYPSMTTYLYYKFINIKTGVEKINKIEIRNFRGELSKICAEVRGNNHYVEGKVTAMFYPVFGMSYRRYQSLILQESHTEVLAFITCPDLHNKYLDSLKLPVDYIRNTILQSILLIFMIESHNRGISYVLKELIRFGMSQTKISAKHYKLL